MTGSDILFITRKFPPSRGGMEKVAYELSRHLSEITGIKIIKWGGPNKWLPFVLPWFFIRSLWILLTGKVSIIYLEDGLLSPLGLLLKFSGKPVAITIHGLDITHNSRLYQALIPRCVRKLDKIICISQATKDACLARGIPEAKIAVIHDGISDVLYTNSNKQALENNLASKVNLDLRGKKTLLFVGRLVERKGIHWFVENVMPIIDRTNCVLVIAGDGVFARRVQSAIYQRGLEESVFMLGRVDEQVLSSLYSTSDVFIMPNIPTKGDMEGFGLVAIEAASCALPVVAANLEGIKAAIQDGKNGFLVEPGNAEAFARTITNLLENDLLRRSFGVQAREFTLENYGWGKVAERYMKEFKCQG